jgi:hypothetical protein
MLIKEANDRQGDIEALNGLLVRPGIDTATRKGVEVELRRVQAGARGEREAAYEIEFHYAKNENRMTIHDLRVEVDGRVAQIDHLIIDRLLGIWVCESKHFSEGVAVDDLGEWTGFYNRRPFGIGSPIEQNRKHIAVLNDVFDQGLVALPKRLGITIKPKLHSLVLVSKNARITRPKTKAGRARVPGLDSVIKVDRLKSILDGDMDSQGVTAFRRIVGRGEIEKVARQLAGLHRPASIDWHARFGIADEVAAQPATQATASVRPTRQECQACGKRVSLAVIAFSRAHGDAFGDRILCMDCQQRARKGRT